MERLTIYITDQTKMAFLLELLSNFDFVQIEGQQEIEQVPEYDFFSSAGMWEGRDIDAVTLRNEAWKRN